MKAAQSAAFIYWDFIKKEEIVMQSLPWTKIIKLKNKKQRLLHNPKTNPKT